MVCGKPDISHEPSLTHAAPQEAVIPMSEVPAPRFISSSDIASSKLPQAMDIWLIIKISLILVSTL